MKDKLVIVTDLGLLKAYKLDATPAGTPRLELLETVTLEDAHHRVTEKVSDLAGRRAAPAQKNWAAPLADGHNLELETKRRLIKQIAAKITRLVRAHALDGCWLAAHKAINHSILGALPTAIRQRIETNLVRDLIKARGPELLEAFGLYVSAPSGGWSVSVTTPTLFSWNLVTKHLHGHELLRKKLHQKISQLARHLKYFPPDAVHLLVALERNPKKEFYTAALTLRVPSNILRSQKSAPDVIKSFDDAVKALRRELESLKSDLRREALWKRKARRAELRATKGFSFAAAPMAAGTGPQNDTDVRATA